MTTSISSAETAHRGDRVVTLALVALLVAAPWPLGSRLPWANTWTATVAVLVGGLWLGLRLTRASAPRYPRLLLPMAAFLTLVGVQLLANLSVYPFGTSLGLRSHAATAFILLVAFNVGGHAATRRLLVGVVLAVGSAVAVFAIVQRLTWNGHLFWFYDPPMGGTFPFGPFNNRNYFAGYMIAAIGPGLGLMLSPGAGRWRWPAAAFFAVGGASVFMSLSRGGLLAFVATSVLALVASATLQRRASAPQLWRRLALSVGVIALALVVSVSAVYLLGQADPVAERLETLLDVSNDSSVGGRLEIWRDTLDMIADRPILGTGLNTFVWGHLPYRSSSTGIPQHAHNEYLEVVAEVGLVGGAICVWFLWLLGTTSLRELRKAPAGFETGFRLGAIASWVGIMVYALTDFPTVIPATSYVLASLAGLACVPSVTDD